MRSNRGRLILSCLLLIGALFAVAYLPLPAAANAPAAPAGGVLYNNGPVANVPGGCTGGADCSRLQDASLGLTIFGFGNNSATGQRMSDQFTIPAGQTWNINTIHVYGYQTGSTTTSTINNVNLQILNGAPNAGGTVVFGDTTTNRLATATFSNAYRELESAPGNTQRPIMDLAVTAVVSLPAGTYWIDYSMAGTLASGPWAPPITITGQATTGDALQFTTAWAPALDGTFPQGIPFIVEGTVQGGPTPTATATGQATATATASPTPGTGNTYCSTETVTIPDNLPAGANSVLNVSDTTTISDLNVSLDVTHSWIGDVAISLNHSATTAELFDRPGYSGTGFGCSGDDLDNTADDEAATAFETSCANTVPAYPAGNSYIPGDPSGPNLAAFDGQSVAGAWTLNISDNAAGDTGTLNGWCLIVGGGGPGPTPTATATPGADPDITVNPSSVTETHNTPPQTTNQNLTIGNVGGATLTWTITEDNGKVATANQKPYVPGTVGNAPAAQGNNSLSASSNASDAAPYRHTLVPSVGSTTVTHSSTQDIETGNSVSCNAGGLHTDNSYYRVFDLAGDFGITDTFTVNEISFAVEQATGATGTQPVSVILYTLTGPFTLANLTEIGREDISLADTAGTIETTAFSPAVVVPVNAILVVEIFTPSGQATGNSFFIGSNTAAQTDPSYLRAADCGITQPTDTAAIGFPDMHIVINATGDVGGGGGACSAPSDIPWLTLSPTNGSTAPGGSSNVTLTFNSATLSQGTYTGTLCIDSNDPDEALVQVPVTLNVGPPTAIDLGSLTQSAGGIRIADFAAAGILLLAGGVLLFRRRK